MTKLGLAQPVRIGIVGLGTVGSGVVRLLVDSADHITRHVGRPIEVAAAVVRDPTKQRDVAVPGGRVSTDIRTISRDPTIALAVLLVGGLEPARSMMVELLENGKDVVTANKALLAEHGPELFELARQQGKSIAFEAAVAGGIPIVAAIGECLAANRIESIRGILNGTSNFILTRMEEDGSTYAEALTLAQSKGFAEADPSMDVDGTDATQKLAILAHLAFGVWVPWKEIPRTGIDTVDIDLIRYAAELGYRIRLVAVARRADGRLALRVAPALVRIGTPLAETRGAYNAVSIVGDAVGPMFFHGLGAGQMPTASAVVADIIDTVVGRAAITFRTTGVLAADTTPGNISSVDTRERHFLRIVVSDRPGVLAKITGILGDHGISIASVIQHDPVDALPGAAANLEAPPPGVSLVIMTHVCPSSDVRAAVAAIDCCDVVRGRSVCLGVLDE
ncbi:MAG: homoserine dehydrogenase [Planctomycetota bacterium]|nr:MAG: homoserine dehydrogenase [Planctomycetota bacterium]